MKSSECTENGETDWSGADALLRTAQYRVENKKGGGREQRRKREERTAEKERRENSGEGEKREQRRRRENGDGENGGIGNKIFKLFRLENPI
ncbi:hypothetical protein BG842_00075 [Haladaptatus sp. W1]|uniref:hypothetical protein n=1 Tax=Haladaptatus sp. W1 TaxID=1897478 RepID=UPI000849E256|nr:hypothetical protein [Haladaptatus sp. W1]ODR81173.1 hypothetical protein BG842_00075 [Haladaptatus sp. W1]